MPTATREVTLIGNAARAPDLVIMGSHDVALDVVVGALAERGFSARVRLRSAVRAAWRRQAAANATSRRCTSSIPATGHL